MDLFLSNFTETILFVIESTGYIGIILLIALESVFAPIPSELILPMTGFLVSKGELSHIGAILSATLGSIIGALVLYYLSRKLGEKRVISASEKYGKWLGISKSDVKKSMGWFEKYGTKVVLFGRVIPTLRSIVSVPAGITEMDIKKFILYTGIGSAIWNTALISIGWSLGENWKQVQQYTKYVEYIVIALIIGVMIFLFGRRKR